MLVVARFHRSLKHVHLFQREIDTAVDPSEEVQSFLLSFNEVKPHESLGQRQPLAVHCAEECLFPA